MFHIKREEAENKSKNSEEELLNWNQETKEKPLWSTKFVVMIPNAAPYSLKIPAFRQEEVNKSLGFIYLH